MRNQFPKKTLLLITNNKLSKTLIENLYLVLKGQRYDSVK